MPDTVGLCAFSGEPVIICNCYWHGPYSSSAEDDESSTDADSASTIPMTLYHAAPMCVRDRIAAEGIKPGRLGEIYAAADPKDCRRLALFLLAFHEHPDEAADGQEPPVVFHHEIDIWEVDRNKTPSAPWQDSTGRAGLLFEGAPSFVSSAPIIPVEAITRRSITARSLGIVVADSPE